MRGLEGSKREIRRTGRRRGKEEEKREIVVRGGVLSSVYRPSLDHLALSLGKTNPSLPQLEVSSHLSSPPPTPTSLPLLPSISSIATISFQAKEPLLFTQHARSMHLVLSFTSTLYSHGEAARRNCCSSRTALSGTCARVYSKAQQASEEAAESRENLH